MHKKINKIEQIDFPSKFGKFIMDVYSTSYTSQPDMHFMLVLRTPSLPETPLLRIHSSCLFGDALGSLYCDCNQQLQKSLNEIGKKGGMLFYLDQDGRGHGLFNKAKELKLQQQGYDTFEASQALNLKADSREFDVVVEILTIMGIGSVKLLTNNPQKVQILEKSNIKVIRCPLEVRPNKLNYRYQKTKKHRFGHYLNKYIQD